MLLNYFKLAVRLMARSPFFTAINVTGLSVGFAVFFILWPFTQAELDSENFIKDRQKIFRTLFNVKVVGGPAAGQEHTGTMQPSIVTSTLFNEKLIDEYTRFIPQDNFWPTHTPGLKAYLVIRSVKKNPVFKIENSICADQNFFEFFDLPFLTGNRATALSQGESIALSESVSNRLFGNQPALGELVTVNGLTFHVTGTFKDLPANSHFNFDVVFSNATKLSFWNDMASTMPLWCFHYCKGEDSASLLETLNKNKERVLGKILNDMKQLNIDYKVEPLPEIVFKNYFDGERYTTKAKFTLTVLAAVSLVVLLMAWMNYINLTISRTRNRFKEIAARKVSGAGTADLFVQFISQSAWINLFAVLVAITIIQLVRNPFEVFFNIYIIPFKEHNLNVFLFFALILAAGILICAIYPTWVTAGLTPRQLINDTSVTQRRLLPSVLTTSQYITALVLIVLILVSHTQLSFILSKDIGINRENVIVIEAPVVGLEENGVHKMISFAGQIKSATGRPEVTLSGRVPGDYPYTAIVRRPGTDQGSVLDTYGGTDENFIMFYELELLAGRNFQKDEKPDVVLLSKHAIERLGFDSPEEAIGSLVEVNNYSEPFTRAEIIGVFRDYRVLPFLSSQNNPESLERGQCFAYMDNLWKEDLPERVSVKLIPGQLDTFIGEAERLFAETFPGDVFNWYFLDDHIGRHYQQQKILRNQISFFTFLAVGVACLGLLGMIANKITDKTKEIGIRRILGAHHLHISFVLLGSTFKQLMVSVVTGIPIAWVLSEQYLMRYSERIELQWWHYGIPVVILLSILMTTVASLLWKAASRNPVDALKYE
ncbi:MAG TPA: ABC transporter permease [Cyclobacteriaceae bacterium]|nr:ABC transporter permease [Cyclobacteriaceae bacterium]